MTDISFEEPRFKPTILLKPGELIQFEYNGTSRIGVVIAPEWKQNCDCYVFDTLEDVEEDLLVWVQTHPILQSGDLFVDFGNEYVFKSFKLDDMLVVKVIEYVIWDDLDGGA